MACSLTLDFPYYRLMCLQMFPSLKLTTLSQGTVYFVWVEKTSEQVLITPPQKLIYGAPTLCATNTITPIVSVNLPTSLTGTLISLCRQQNAFFLHTLFLGNETQIGEKKKYWTMFYNRITVRMQQFGTNPSKIEKWHRSVMLSALHLSLQCSYCWSFDDIKQTVSFP